jgi:NDP-sugar pyrophosphorylase family protein
MRPHTETVPKALLPVAGRPFADLQLEWLAAQGVSDVVYSIGYLGEQIVDHVGDGGRFGLSVDYVREENGLLGTAGALRLAAEEKKLADEFLVLFGDSHLEISIPAVTQAFSSSGSEALMTVYRNDGQFDASNVVYATGRVLRYEKGLQPAPPEMRWIDYGLSVLRRSTIEREVAAGAIADLAPIMTALAASGQLAGYEATERFHEVGSSSGLADLEELLAGVRAEGSR